MSEESRDGDIEFTIKDIEAYMQSSLETADEPFGSCRHFQVVLDEQSHTVTCKKCSKILDPFWYLCLLSSEWVIRKYQDDAAIKARDEIKRVEQNARLKGKIFMRPTKECAAQEAWDTYVEYHSKDPYQIYRMRGDWWASDDKGGSESISYIRMLIAARLKLLP